MQDQSKRKPAHRQSTCKQCSAVFRPHGENPGIYCSRKCKADWQRTQKPVDRDWLHEKYIVEGKSAVDIAAIVGRHPKRVWEWIRDYGIPTRPRGHCALTNPAFTFWLDPVGKHPMKGRKHGPEFCKRMSEIARAQGRVPYDPAVGSYMKGRRGAAATNWKGGVTPERQAFYASSEWKEAAKAVWARDDATCRRCGVRNRPGERFAFDIHHVISFAFAPTRADVDNLVLLCEKCHYWVHSNENTARDFIKEAPDASR